MRPSIDAATTGPNPLSNERDSRDAPRSAQMRPLAASLGGITRAALGKKGFALAQLLSDWESIVGPALAAAAAPI